MKKKWLANFDFDGTIANVPERPAPGVDQRGWSGRDWWGSRQSLCSPEEGGFYDGSVNQEVIDAFLAARQDPEADVVLSTGRRSPAAAYVRAILRKHGLVGRRMIDDSLAENKKWFQRLCERGEDEIHPDECLDCAHEEYYVGDILISSGPKNTFGHKAEVLHRKFRANGGSYEKLEIWDDRLDHLELFKSLGRQFLSRGQVEVVTINRVIPPQFENVPATIIRYDLK